VPAGWLYWAPLVAASLHIVEEFAYPGGFVGWYRRSYPKIAASITPRLLVIVNVLLVILCYDVGALAGRPSGAFLWLVVMALLFANAVWHVVGAVRTRSYSPGLVTGLLLYMPVTVYGVARLIGRGELSLLRAGVALAAGSSYQLWANLLHRQRARGAARRSC
jgi:Protein of unknown function with HXXEE motif